MNGFAAQSEGTQPDRPEQEITVVFRGVPLSMTLSEARDLACDVMDAVQAISHRQSPIAIPLGSFLSLKEIQVFFEQVHPTRHDARRRATRLFGQLLRSTEHGTHFEFICSKCYSQGYKVNVQQCDHGIRAEQQVGVASLRFHAAEFRPGMIPKLTAVITNDLTLLVDHISPT